MEHNLFPLEFQLPDRKHTLQTAQKCYQLKIQSFCRCYLRYTCCLHHHLYHECMKYPFALVTLIWVYLTLPSFFLKALCTRLLILDFNRTLFLVYLVLASLLALFQGVYICAHPGSCRAIITQTQFSRKTRKT